MSSEKMPNTYEVGVDVSTNAVGKDNGNAPSGHMVGADTGLNPITKGADSRTAGLGPDAKATKPPAGA